MDRLRQGWVVRQRLLLTVSLNQCFITTQYVIYEISNPASTLILRRTRLDTPYAFMTLFWFREHPRAGPAFHDRHGERASRFFSALCSDPYSQRRCSAHHYSRPQIVRSCTQLTDTPFRFLVASGQRSDGHNDRTWIMHGWPSLGREGIGRRKD